MFRSSHWALSACVLLTATFAGFTSPTAALPAHSDQANAVDAQQAQRTALIAAPRPAGADVFQGRIDGVVRVNGKPMLVTGSVNVHGDWQGPNSSTGIAMARAETGGDRFDGLPSVSLAYAEVSTLPASMWPWIIPDSNMDEMPIMTALGDWAVIEVDFSGAGWLTYDIRVVSADPLLYAIGLQGGLIGEPTMPPLPWERGLNLCFHQDGTITGDGFASGRLVSGETYHVPALIRGSFSAAAPSVPLPARVSGRLSIRSFDPASGQWTARGSRVVASAGDLPCDGLDNDGPIGEKSEGPLSDTLK
jgi:hypothetical protein